MPWPATYLSVVAEDGKTAATGKHTVPRVICGCWGAGGVGPYISTFNYWNYYQSGYIGQTVPAETTATL